MQRPDIITLTNVSPGSACISAGQSGRTYEQEKSVALAAAGGSLEDGANDEAATGNLHGPCATLVLCKPACWDTRKCTSEMHESRVGGQDLIILQNKNGFNNCSCKLCKAFVKACEVCLI